MKKVFFETERLILRPFEKKDFFDFKEYFFDERVNKYLGVLMPEREDIADRIFNDNLNSFTSWAVELKENRKVIGDFHFDNIIGGYLAHFGFALNFDYHKEGYAFEASDKIIRYAFDELNFGRIRAAVLFQNISSLKLLEKLGFEKEALLYEFDFGGKIENVFFLSKINEMFL